jgi:hypothetical protein
MGQGNETRDDIRAILKDWLDENGLKEPEAWTTQSEGEPEQVNGFDTTEDDRIEEQSGRYDFDLAEFPLFRLHTASRAYRNRDPLEYSDTITGRDGKPVVRKWKVYPGAFGFGGATAQLLLYDLLQFYAEQGARGSQIQFGTLHSVLLRRNADRHPSKRDYDRLRQDFDILRGYDFHCVNAFWHPERKAYVDMNWRLFGSVFYFKPGPADADRELPFGFIEVSPVLRRIAQTRGFFSLGFGRTLFYRLKPLEQRLAVYLAKKFVSQKLHRRFVDDLVRALPIQTAQARDARIALKSAAQGLLDAGVPFLERFRLEKSTTGRWLAVFARKHAPKQDRNTVRFAGEALAPAVLDQIDRIVEAVGGADDRAWWTQCVTRLGTGAVDRALGLLKEARETQAIRNPGGLLTRLFQKIAAEYDVALN